MYSVIILVTAGLTNLNFLDLVNAQGNLTEGLEPCAVACWNNASAYSGCGQSDTTSDMACGCFSPNFQASIGPCIMSTCDTAANEGESRFTPVDSVTQILADTTTLCAFVGGTTPDYPGAISSLAAAATQPPVSASTCGIGLAESIITKASSFQVSNSKDILGISATGTGSGASLTTISSTPSLGLNTSTPGTPSVPVATYIPGSGARVREVFIALILVGIT